MRSHHSSGSPVGGFFVVGSFFVFVMALIALGFYWNYHNRKKIKKFIEKNGLNYKPSDSQIISQFTPFYKINLKTYDTGSLTDIITGTKNNIKITMLSTEQKSGNHGVYYNHGNVNFKQLVNNQNADFRKINNDTEKQPDETSVMPELLPLKLNSCSTILKLEGDFNLPKFKLVSRWTPPQMFKNLVKLPEMELPDYAIKFPGEFGKYFYVDYYEDESISQLFDLNLLNDFVRKNLKAKGPIIGLPWQFISLGNIVIVDFAMPTNADMKINLLENAIRLTLMFNNEAKHLS